MRKVDYEMTLWEYMSYPVKDEAYSARLGHKNITYRIGEVEDNIGWLMCFEDVTEKTEGNKVVRTVDMRIKNVRIVALHI